MAKEKVKISNKMKKQNLTIRPPVVVILGHVDAGKTSILDTIRKTHIAEKESGSITQHIGAYQIELDAPFADSGQSSAPNLTRGQAKKITFLDTPGHEAFSQMRSRGAKVADIAVLVIDAIEGVQIQTKEVISHIKRAGIPVIVAINKIDRPEADPEKAKQGLAKENILVESMGGKIPEVLVSAKTGKGIPELLELISLVAEMEGLKADLQKPAEGAVIESCLDDLRGPTATLLLSAGILKPGDVVGTPSALTRIKSLENFQKIPIEKALPSDPVIVFGFNQAPRVGEEFKVFPDLEKAKNYLKVPEILPRAKETPVEGLEISEGQKILNLVLKADVLGSLEAIEGILKNLPQEKIVLRILKSEAGNINESDLRLAKNSRAIILGFRVKIDSIVKKISEREKIKIMQFQIIYDLVEGVRKFMEKSLKSEEVKTELGKVMVLVKFITEKNRIILGGKVILGEVKKGALTEVYRNEEKIGSGKLINLQRNKKDIDKISKGGECGILFEGDAKIEEGDILSIYIIEHKKNEL